MNIAFISSEVAPYSKTGGLSEVSGALPAALKKAGNSVKTISPLYRQVKESTRTLEETGIKIAVPLGNKILRADIWRKEDCFFIGNDAFFNREEFYGNSVDDYPDNALRFAFLSRAAIELLKNFSEKVDLIHCNDWQTGLVPLYLRLYYSGKMSLPGKPATLFTIHNLVYQGLFEREKMPALSLPHNLFNHHELEFYGQISFIKTGLVFADMLSTVSEKYSREIQKEELGCGLDGLLRKRKKDLVGIPNGIDYEKWNPEMDGHLVSTYSRQNLKGKAACKKELKKIFGLTGKGDIPLIGMISRLDPQKGFSLIEEAGEKLMKLPIQIVFLGKGDETIQIFLERLEKKHPGRVGLKIGYDEALAHKIEAGSDVFLMPSRFEPCGLNQLYSLKYGTIPVVRATGGLDDTITGYSAARKSGNGFKFRAFTGAAMVTAIRRAVDLYHSDKSAWNTLQKRGMAEEYSWERAALAYEKLYRQAIKKSGGRGGKNADRGKDAALR